MPYPTRENYGNYVPSHFQWLLGQKLKESYKSDSEIQEILRKIHIETINSFKYIMHDVLLLHRGKIYLGKKCLLKKAVLQQVHDNPKLDIQGMRRP